MTSAAIATTFEPEEDRTTNLSLIPELHPLDIAKIETDRRFNSATEIVPDELQPLDEQNG